MTTLSLVRHGRLGGDAERRFVGRSDLPMSPEGEIDVARAAARLADAPIDVVLCSGLARSRRTAEILRGDRDVPIRIEASLAEIDMGDWEGLERSGLARRDPAAWAARGTDLAGYRPPGGESFGDLAARLAPLLGRLVGGDFGEDVVVAGHAGTNRVLLARLLGLSLADIFRLDQPYGGIWRLELVDGRVVRADFSS